MNETTDRTPNPGDGDLAARQERLYRAGAIARTEELLRELRKIVDELPRQPIDSRSPRRRRYDEARALPSARRRALALARLGARDVAVVIASATIVGSVVGAVAALGVVTSAAVTRGGALDPARWSTAIATSVCWLLLELALKRATKRARKAAGPRSRPAETTDVH